MPIRTTGGGGGPNKTTRTTTTPTRTFGGTAMGFQGLTGLRGGGGYRGTFGGGANKTATQAYNTGFNRGVAAGAGAGGTALGLNRGMANTGRTFAGPTGPAMGPANPFAAAMAQTRAPTIQNRANPVAQGRPAAPRGTIDYLNQRQAVKAGVNLAQTPNYRTTANYQPNYAPRQDNVVTKAGQPTDFADFYGAETPRTQTAPGALFAGNQGAAPGGVPAPARQTLAAARGAPAGRPSIFTPGAQTGSSPSDQHRQVIDTLIAEADLNDPVGLLSVAHAMNNRSRYSGASIYDVVSAPSQFSGYKHPGTEAVKAQQDPEVRARAEQAFQDAVTGRVPDPTGGADYFHTPAVNPTWAAKFQHITDAGGHKFYRNPGKDAYRTGGGNRPVGPAAPVGTQFVGNQREPEGLEPVMEPLAAQQIAAERFGPVGGIGSDKDAGLYAPPPSGRQSPTRGPAMRGEVPVRTPYTPGSERYTPWTEAPPPPEHYSPFTDARPVQDAIATQRALEAREAHIAKTARVRAGMLRESRSKDEPVSSPPPSRGEKSSTPFTRAPGGNPQASLYYGSVAPQPDSYRPEDSPRAPATNPLQAAAEQAKGYLRTPPERPGRLSAEFAGDANGDTIPVTPSATGPFTKFGPEAAPSSSGHFVPGAWTVRNSVNLADVDPELVQAHELAASEFALENPGYRVEAISGKASREHTKNHPYGKAIDVSIIGPDGKEIPNIASDKGWNTEAFQTYQAFAQKVADIRTGKPTTWGGNFSDTFMDVMHIDNRDDIGGLGSIKKGPYAETIRDYLPGYMPGYQPATKHMVSTVAGYDATRGFLPENAIFGQGNVVDTSTGKPAYTNPREQPPMQPQTPRTPGTPGDMHIAQPAETDEGGGVLKTLAGNLFPGATRLVEQTIKEGKKAYSEVTGGERSMAALTERMQNYRGKDHAGTTITREEVEAFLRRRDPKVLKKLSTEGKLALLAEAGKSGSSRRG